MARIACPWFWEERQGWYVNKDGQRHFLGEHPEGAPLPRKIKGKWNAPQLIVQAFHALMAAPPAPETFPKTSPQADGASVAEIFDKYLAWCQKHRAGRTYDWYREHIQGFLDFKPEVAHLAAADLRPFHVIEWADSHGEDWSNAYRRGGIVAIQRPFNWAEEMGYIAANPIKRIKKPQPQRRDNPITPEDFAVLLSHFPEGDPFRDLLLFSWHSGCRPQEAKHIEPRHVLLAQGMIVIPKEEAKGKRKPRVIHLAGPALEIITRMMAIRTGGKLFLNEDGVPWKKSAIAKRFERSAEKIGIQTLKDKGIAIPPLPRFNHRDYEDKAALAAARRRHQKKIYERRKEILKRARKHSTRFAAYDLRHGFATRKLVQGVDALTVAELMGHRDGTMLAKVYQHLDRNHDHLKKALED